MIINIQDDILKIQALGLLDKILTDKTMKRNIMWATDAHSALGTKYERNEQIITNLITGSNAGVRRGRWRCWWKSALGDDTKYKDSNIYGKIAMVYYFLNK